MTEEKRKYYKDTFGIDYIKTYQDDEYEYGWYVTDSFDEETGLLIVIEYRFRKDG